MKIRAPLPWTSSRLSSFISGISQMGDSAVRAKKTGHCEQSEAIQTNDAGPSGGVQDDHDERGNQIAPAGGCRGYVTTNWQIAQMALSHSQTRNSFGRFVLSLSIISPSERPISITAFARKSQKYMFAPNDGK
jgi:hypothetical protein